MPLIRRREFPLRVSDIMVKDVIIANKNDKIRDVALKMYENKVGSVVIVDEERRPIGIVTERDMVYVCAHALSPDTSVWMIMSENPVTVNENALVTEVLEKMRNLDVRHIPVVNSAGKLVGIVSFRDLIDVVVMLMTLR